MEQPVTIKYRWTAEELLQAQRFHFRHTCRPVIRFALHVIFALMILAGYGWIHGGKSLSVGIGFIVAGVYWFAIRPFDRRWTVRRQFAKRPDKDLEIEWQITSDKLSAKSTAHASETTWQMIGKVVRAPTGLLLYSNDQMFHWLPRHGFGGDGEFERLAEIARSKVQRFHTVA